MGCWNATCGLTQLPITHGQKIRVYILAPNKYKDISLGNGHCYPTDLYEVLTLPIEGEYNDYGGIENVKKTNSAKGVLAYFNARIKSGQIEIKDEDSDKPVAKFKTVENLINSIARGGSPFSLFMVLENTYQGAIKAMEVSASKCKYKSQYRLEALTEIRNFVKRKLRHDNK